MALDINEILNRAKENVSKKGKYGYSPKGVYDAAEPSVSRAKHELELEREYNALSSALDNDINTVNEYIKAVNSGVYSSADDMKRYRSAFDRYRENTKKSYDVQKALGRAVDEDAYIYQNAWLDAMEGNIKRSEAFADMDMAGVNDIIKDLQKYQNMADVSQYKSREEIESQRYDRLKASNTIALAKAALEDNKDLYTEEEYRDMNDTFDTLIDMFENLRVSTDAQRGYYGQFSGGPDFKYKDYSNKELLDMYFEAERYGDEETAGGIYEAVFPRLTKDEFDKWLTGAKKKYDSYNFNTIEGLFLGKENAAASNRGNVTGIGKYESAAILNDIDDLDYPSVDAELNEIADSILEHGRHYTDASYDKSISSALRQAISSDLDLLEAEFDSIEEVEKLAWTYTPENVEHLRKLYLRYVPEAYYQNRSDNTVMTVADSMDDSADAFDIAVIEFGNALETYKNSLMSNHYYLRNEEMSNEIDKDPRMDEARSKYRIFKEWDNKIADANDDVSLSTEPGDYYYSQTIRDLNEEAFEKEYGMPLSEYKQKIIDIFDENGYDYTGYDEYQTRLENEKDAVARYYQNKAFVDSGPFEAIAANIKSVLTSPFEVTAYLDTWMNIGNNDKDIRKYIPVDTNTDYYDVYNDNKAITEATIDAIDNDIGEWFYQTGMSIADTAFRMGVSGGNALAFSALTFSDAATQSTMSAVERGVSPEQAVSYGTAVGIVELMTESFSLSKLKAFKSGGVTSPKEWLTGTLKQVVTEASEETAAGIADRVLDDFVNRDKSQYNLALQNYINEGYSETEAKELADKDYMIQLLSETLAGGLSGGVFGAATGGINYGAYRSSFATYNTSEFSNEEVEALNDDLRRNLSKNGGVHNAENISYSVDEIKAIGYSGMEYLIDTVESNYSKDTKEYKTAEEVKKQITDGKKVTDKQTRKLVEAIATVYEGNTESEDVSVFPRIYKEQAEKMNETVFMITVDKVVGYAKEGNADPKFVEAVKKYEMSDTELPKIHVDDILDIVNSDGTGNMTVSTNGGELTVKPVQLEGGEKTVLYRAAAGLDTEGAKELISSYETSKSLNPELSLDDYVSSFTAIYNAARMGLDVRDNYEDIDRNVSILGDTLSQAAYNVGLHDAQARVDMEERIPAVEAEKAGTVTDTGNSLSEAERGVVQAVAEKLQIPIVVTNEYMINGKSYKLSENNPAKYIVSTATMLLSPDAENLTGSLLHELGEFVKATSPAESKQITTALIKFYAEEFGSEKAHTWIRTYQSAYAAAEGSKSYDAATREVMHDAMAAVFSKERNTQKFIDWLGDTQTKKNANKIKTWFARLLGKLKSAIHSLFTDGELNPMQKEVAKLQEKKLESLADMFINALDESRAKVQKTTKKEVSETSDVKNTLIIKMDKVTTGENLNDVVNMKTVANLSGTEFAKGNVDLISQVETYFDSLGNEVQSKYGLVELTRKGIKSSIGHGIGRNKAIAFTAVPDVISKGKVIDYQYNWKGRGYDTAVFAAPITIGKDGYYLGCVVNVEADRNYYYLHEVILQKKENNAMFKTGTAKNGTSGKALSPLHILLQRIQNVNTDSTNQITITSKRENNSYNKLPQNTQLKDASGRKLSPQQLEYFAKSVIRDAKGRLLAVYHGTKNAGFFVFNKSDDIGYFFARSKSTASTYSRSDKVFAPTKETAEFEGAAMYEVYLDIRNPLIIEAKGALWNALEEKGERVELEINCKSVGENGKCNVVVDYTRSGKNKRLKFTNSSDLYDFFATTFDSNLARALDLNLGQAIGENGKGKISGQFPWDFDTNKRGSVTKTRDIVRRAVESKNNYDGVIFKNIVDPGSWQKIKPDDVYVVFNSNQVKSVNNTEPTIDLDIRNQINIDRYISNLFEEDKYFRSQISKWNDLSYGRFVKVGAIKPEHPLNKVGMPSGAVRYDVSKIKKNMADHKDYLTEDLLRSIPNIIANPIAITEYSKNSNTVSVFGDYFVSGSPMMVGITISKDRAGNDISKIRTFNTRRDVSKLITDDSILYLGENKKRTLEWFQACGIQVPLGGTKFGFIRSISRNYEIVNTSSNISDEDAENQIKINGQDLAHIDDNEELKAIVVDMIEQKIRTSKSRRNILSKDVRPFAKKILADNASSYNLTTFTSELTKLYELMARNERADVIRHYADYIGEKVLRAAENNGSISDRNKAVLDDIKGVPIKLTKMQKEILADKYGMSFEEFAAKTSEYMTFSSYGRYIHDRWSELSSLYPNIFESGMPKSEMAMELADIALRLSDTYNGELSLAEDAQFLGGELIAGMIDLNDMPHSSDPVIDLNNAFVKSMNPYTKSRENMLDQSEHDMVARSVKDVIDFVREAFSDTNSKKTLHLGSVTEGTFERIFAEIENLPEGLEKTLFRKDREYSITISQDTVRHLTDEKQNVSEALVIEYVLQLPSIVNYFDSVAFDYYKPGTTKQRNGLIFKKKLPDGRYIGFELISKKSSEFQTQTLYLESGDFQQKKKAGPTMPVQKALGYTSETLASLLSNDRIAQSIAKVNTGEGFVKKIRSNRQKYIDKLKKENASLRKGIIIRQQHQALVKSIGKRTQKLRRQLLDETDNDHIPEKYKGVVAAFLDELVGTGMFDELGVRRLRDAFKNILGDSNIFFDEAEGQHVGEIIENITEILMENGGKTLREFDTADLIGISELVDRLNYMVNEANTTFLKDKKTTLEKLGDRTLSELEQKKNRKVSSVVLMRKISSGADQHLRLDNLTPQYFFDDLGGVWLDLYEDLLESQNKWAWWSYTGKDMFKKAQDKYHYKDWSEDKHEITAEGQKIMLDIESILTIYATAQRQKRNRSQDARHLQEGGIFLEDNVVEHSEDVKEERADGKKKKIGKKYTYTIVESAALKLSDAEIATVEKLLTEDQKGYVNSVVEFLSTECASWGNEASMKMFGIKKFTESYYFPYNTPENFKYTKSNYQDVANRVKSASFAHRTVKNANSPIIVSSFTEIASSHIDSMAMYGGFVVQIENMNSVFNYQGVDGKGGKLTVKDALLSTYGNHNVAMYIQTFMRDVQGGVVDSRDSNFDKYLSMFKKSRIMFSSSVIFRQYWTVIRAMTEIDINHFEVTPHYSKASQEELRKYAPIFIVKEMGGFDTVSSRSASSWISGKDNKGLLNKLDNFGGLLPGVMDKAAWLDIWTAVKNETTAKLDREKSDIEVGSEEFLKMAGKRFTEVVNKTQVYNSTLSKSHIMRGKNVFVRSITAFMAESQLILNMRYGALRSKNFKRILRVSACLIASGLLDAAAASLAYAASDEDEDNNFLERWIGHTVGTFIDGYIPFGQMAFVKDIYSMIMGYGISRTEYEVLEDLVDSIIKCWDEDATPWEKGLDVASAFSSFADIPLRNGIREVKGWMNFFSEITDGSEKTKAYNIESSIVQNTDLFDFIWGENYTASGLCDEMYEAILSGDIKRYEKIKEQYLNSGENRDMEKVTYEVSKRLRSNVILQNVVLSYLNSEWDLYEDSYNELLDLGFSKEMIDKAFDSLLGTAKKVAKAEKGSAEYDEQIDALLGYGFEDDDIELLRKNSNEGKLDEAYKASIKGDSKKVAEIVDVIIEQKKKDKLDNYPNYFEVYDEKDLEKNAISAARDVFNTKYRDEYLEAYEEGNGAEEKRILDLLGMTGLYKNIEKTADGWIEEYEKEKLLKGE